MRTAPGVKSRGVTKIDLFRGYVCRLRIFPLSLSLSLFRTHTDSPQG